MKNGFVRTGWVVMVGLLVGCAGQKTVIQQPLCAEAIAKEKLMQTAEKMLVSMQFTIEKYDVENGVIRTRPLRGGQCFELWRKDNASNYAVAESNLQSIQRTVELAFNADATQLCINCTATVQRLSLPDTPIEGYLNAPGLYTNSSRNKQRLIVDSEKMDKMRWIDMGRDEALESKILGTIQKKIAKGIK